MGKIYVDGLGTVDIQGSTPTAEESQAIMRAVRGQKAPQQAPQVDPFTAGLKHGAMTAIRSLAELGNLLSNPVTAGITNAPLEAQQQQSDQRYQQIEAQTPYQQAVDPTLIRGRFGIEPKPYNTAALGNDLGNMAVTAPVAAAGGELVDAALPLASEGEGFLPAAFRMGRKMAVRGAEGGAAGGVQPGNRIENAVIGGALGAALPVAGEAASAGGRFAREAANAGHQIFSPKAAARSAVGGILKDEGTQPFQLHESGIPGFQPTLAGSTGDPGYASLERFVRQRTTPDSGANEPVFQQRQAQNAQAITNYLEKNLGQIGSSKEAAAKMHGVVQNALDAAKADESALWDQIPADQRFNTNFLKNRFKKWYGGLSATPKTYIPKRFVSIIENYKGAQPFSELKDLRSAISAEAGATNNNYQRALLMHLANDVVAGGTSDAAIMTGSEPVVQAWKNANDFTRNLHERFDQRNIATALRGDATGAGTQLAGSPERIDAYFKAAGQTPEAKQALAEHIVNVLYDKAALRPPTGEAAPLNSDVLDKYWRQNPGIINKALPSDAQKIVLRNIIKASRMNRAAEKAVPRIGSDTAAKLRSNSILDGLLAKIPGTGWVTRGAAAITKPLFSQYTEEADKLLRDALLDPQVAAGLLRKNTPSNLLNLQKILQTRAAKLAIRAGKTGIVTQGAIAASGQ